MFFIIYNLWLKTLFGMLLIVANHKFRVLSFHLTFFPFVNFSFAWFSSPLTAWDHQPIVPPAWGSPQAPCRRGGPPWHHPAWASLAQHRADFDPGASLGCKNDRAVVRSKCKILVLGRGAASHTMSSLCRSFFYLKNKLILIEKIKQLLID